MGLRVIGPAGDVTAAAISSGRRALTRTSGGGLLKQIEGSPCSTPPGWCCSPPCVANGVAEEAVLDGMWSSARSCLGGKTGSATVYEVTSVYTSLDHPQKESRNSSRRKGCVSYQENWKICSRRSAKKDQRRMFQRRNQRKCSTSEAPGDPAEVRPLEDILPGRLNEE
jgi:hypothetical protein